MEIGRALLAPPVACVNTRVGVCDSDRNQRGRSEGSEADLYQTVETSELCFQQSAREWADYAHSVRHWMLPYGAIDIFTTRQFSNSSAAFCGAPGAHFASTWRPRDAGAYFRAPGGLCGSPRMGIGSCLKARRYRFRIRNPKATGRPAAICMSGFDPPLIRHSQVSAFIRYLPHHLCPA